MELQRGGNWRVEWELVNVALREGGCKDDGPICDRSTGDANPNPRRRKHYLRNIAMCR